MTWVDRLILQSGHSSAMLCYLPSCSNPDTLHRLNVTALSARYKSCLQGRLFCRDASYMLDMYALPTTAAAVGGDPAVPAMFLGGLHATRMTGGGRGVLLSRAHNWMSYWTSIAGHGRVPLPALAAIKGHVSPVLHRSALSRAGREWAAIIPSVALRASPQRA